MAGKSRISRIVQWSLVALLVVLLIIKFLFIDFYIVPQNGMYPGLPAGSRLFVSRRAYSDASQVRRGDVVVFVRHEGGKRYVFIWRVIGLPGDTIEASGESLIVNGQAVARERLREEQDSVIYRERAGDVEFDIAFGRSREHPPPDTSLTVPPGHFFVMGDNRFHALDSRYSGPIAFDAIIGRKL